MLLPGRIMFISVHGDPLDTLGGIQSGGQNVYVRELARELDHLGVEVDVFTHHSNPGLPKTEPLGNNSNVIRLSAGFKGFIPKHQMFAMLPAFIKELTHRKATSGYALIHSNYWLSGWAGLQLQTRFRIPRVHTSHSLGAVKNQSIASGSKESLKLRISAEKDLLQRSERIIATTPLEKDVLVNNYSVSPNKIRLIPCGVNTEIFCPPETTKQFKTGKKTVLFVGRFEENKGLEVLLRSVAILIERFPLSASGFHLVIAGGDRLGLPPDAVSPEKRRYLEIIRNLGVHDLVSFIGPQMHRQLPELFAGSWVTVVPSYYESFGLVALEAMACGCPVIASKTGGLKHIVIHGKTGLHVEPKNAEELAYAINFLLTNETLREKMSRQAALHVRQFAWKKIASKMVDTYRETIQCQGI